MDSPSDSFNLVVRVWYAIWQRMRCVNGNGRLARNYSSSMRYEPSMENQFGTKFRVDFRRLGGHFGSIDARPLLLRLSIILSCSYISSVSSPVPSILVTSTFHELSLFHSYLSSSRSVLKRSELISKPPYFNWFQILIVHVSCSIRPATSYAVSKDR
jgi:hypothetical protein